MARYVRLTDGERSALQATLSAHTGQKALNALILFNCDVADGNKKMSNEAISRVLQVSMRKIDRVKRRYAEDGLAIALTGRPTSRDYHNKFDTEMEQRIREIYSGIPPKDVERWTFQRFADYLVETGVVSSISYETLRKIIKGEYNPHNCDMA